MSRIRFLAAALWIICLSGCAAVYSTQPVGVRPHVVTPADWEGTWLHREGAITIMVVDAAQGLLQAGWVEKKQDSLSCEQFRIFLREYGGWILGSVENPERPGLYVWGRVRREGEQVLVWTPIPEKIAGLVKKGKLPGKAEKGGDVLLETLTEKHLRQITAGSKDVLFLWEYPVTLIRLGK